VLCVCVCALTFQDKMKTWINSLLAQEINIYDKSFIYIFYLNPTEANIFVLDYEGCNFKMIKERRHALPHQACHQHLKNVIERLTEQSV
jgi:hypothetical protein